MRTSNADVVSPVEYDFSKGELGRYARRPGEGLDIRIDGAIGYSLRLIPSNKVVGRFSTTSDAWSAVITEIDRGIPARCLVLDWHWANGRRGQVSSGRLLVSVARSGLGLDVAQERVRTAS
jgi:hypothetical protein